MKKVLFVTAHRKNRAPNQRFRFEQYYSILTEQGFTCIEAPLIRDAGEDALFYARGRRLEKILLGIRMGWRRLQLLKKKNSFDIIFIAREAFFTGTFFEKKLAKSRAKIIFDFDDAIWLDAISPANRFFSWLKSGKKTNQLIGLADLVFAGNDYLAGHAKSFNQNVLLVPTTIDTTVYIPQEKARSNKVVIGWSGSISTIAHFTTIVPALLILKKKFSDVIEFKVIGDRGYKNEALGIEGLPWKFETELRDLQDLDIGIMPLPDDEWTRGKCGLKGLQYMSLEIPTVMSPVGVNIKIIEDGKNGFLASTTEEWVEKLSGLITQPGLRKEIGMAGRKTVVLNWSVASQRQRYLDAFNSLV